MIKGIIFDLDGVLVSTDEMHYLAWKRLADELQITGFTREDNRRQRGVSRMASLEIVLEKADCVYTEEEKAEKARVMEAALKEACSVPMEIMEKCCEAIELIVEFGAKGSKLAISDAGVGAAFCKAALKGASLNVYINTKSMADRAYAEELNKKADAMLEKYTKIADETFDSVLGRLK